MTLKDKVTACKALKVDYMEAYARDDNETAVKLERQYLDLRREVLDEVNDNITKKKSIPLAEVRKRVESEKKPIPIETGVRSLDEQLVDNPGFGKVGGFPLGNLINIVGSKGVGKTTLLMKILSNFSHQSPVSWFNFEMSDRQVTEKIKPFEANEENILYYSSDRDLDAILDEIKFLNADGVKHFVIDSNMKIHTKRTSNILEKHSIVSDELKELTSVLDINIYLINQVSQAAERDGTLQLKGGNDAEFDADMILFIVKKPLKDQSGKLITDELGLPLFDEDRRFIKCTKNRIYDRLFFCEIPKSEIFKGNITEIEYNNNIDLPVL